MQPLFVALLPDKGGENLVLFFIFNPPYGHSPYLIYDEQGEWIKSDTSIGLLCFLFAL